MSRFGRSLVAAGTLLLALASPASAVVVQQVDTFETPGTASWGNGGGTTDAIQNIATGGPAGTDDNFLRITSTGTFGPGRALVAFNTSDRWKGDYLASGVDAIRMNVNNQGGTDLVLRLIIAGPQNLGTVAPVNLPAGSGWTTVTFPLTPGNLTGGTYSTTMAAVGGITLLHSPSTATTLGSGIPSIAATLGVDNITAVPEPGLAGVVVGTMALLGRRTRRTFKSLS